MTDQQQASAAPQYSPDGQWWWDGRSWVPVHQPAPQPVSQGRRLVLMLALAAVGVILVGFLAILFTRPIGTQHDTDELDNYCQIFPEDC